MKRIWILGAVIAVALSAIGPLVSARHFAEWSNPVNLGSPVSSTQNDTCPTLTKSGLSMYFASNVTGGLRDLYVAQRPSEDDEWGAPQALGANINTTAGDERCPYVTPDGRRLIFARGTMTSPGDFYMSVRQDKRDDLGWGNPVKLDAINSTADETAMWGFEDEESGKLILYFGSNRTTGVPAAYDVYETTMDEEGNFTAPVLVNELSSSDPVTLGTLNTTSADYFPVVSKDGLELFLTSNRAGNLGPPSTFDIWVSTRQSTSEAWSAPINLASVNTPYNEMRSALSWDGQTMILGSNRPGGLGLNDLWQYQREKVTGQNK